MHKLRQLLRRVFRKCFLLWSRFRFWLHGIDAVIHDIAHCSKHEIPDLLRAYGAKLGEDIHFKDGMRIDNPDLDSPEQAFANLSIGNDVYIGKDVFFDLPEKIIIEDHALISAGAMLLTHHDCGYRMMSQYYPRKTGAVKIGRGSWIGVNAVILHGVELGEGCVVAAGSIVTKSSPPYKVLAGSPAKPVRTLRKPAE